MPLIVNGTFGNTGPFTSSTSYLSRGNPALPYPAGGRRLGWGGNRGTVRDDLNCSSERKRLTPAPDAQPGRQSSARKLPGS